MNIEIMGDMILKEIYQSVENYYNFFDLNQDEDELNPFDEIEE